MDEFRQLIQIAEKIRRLLDSVAENGGKFTAIDKDILTNYVREQYELIVGINTRPSPVVSFENQDYMKLPADPVKLKEEKPAVNGNQMDDGKNSVSPEMETKKTISDIYAFQKENKSTVNDKFKKQGPEIADKLKQTPIKDLKSYIGLNKQFAFMSKLFNADEQLYEDAIARLNSFSSYEEATGFIQSELLPSLNWSDDEPLVSEFFTLVMRRYLN
ncbi:MAG: hypothetical protein ABIQ74_02340 [Chitinophagales bacterium]